MKVRLCIATMITISALTCGNPSIRYLLIPVPKKVEVNGRFFNLAKVTNSKKNKTSDDDNDSVVVYENNEIKIVITSLDAEELDELAEKLGSYSNQRYYRLPGLRYLKFIVSYSGSKKTKLNLFSSYFIDEFGKKYAPFGIEEYQKTYTSSSYSVFDYNYIYSFYFTKKGEVKPEDDEFYVSKVLPEKDVVLQTATEGFQILPYELLSVGSRKYWLHLEINDGETKIRYPFYYRAIRSDQK